MLIFDKHRDALKKFVDIYGTLAQLDMLVEKMAMLTASINRYKRKINKCKTDDERKCLQKKCEEGMAHVLVLMEQIKMIFDENSISMFAEQNINKQKVKIII